MAGAQEGVAKHPTKPGLVTRKKQGQMLTDLARPVRPATKELAP